jgi:hypothetical protein
MALQTSGPISISNIKAELGSASNSLRALSSAAGFSTPDAMSEFYGYSSFGPEYTEWLGMLSGSQVSLTGEGIPSNPWTLVVDTVQSGDDWGAHPRWQITGYNAPVKAYVQLLSYTPAMIQYDSPTIFTWTLSKPSFRQKISGTDSAYLNSSNWPYDPTPVFEISYGALTSGIDTWSLPFYGWYGGGPPAGVPRLTWKIWHSPA